MGSKLYRDLVRLLREAGCEFVRQGRGSHERFSIPRNTVKVHTANSVLNDAGLPKAF